MCRLAFRRSDSSSVEENLKQKNIYTGHEIMCKKIQGSNKNVGRLIYVSEFQAKNSLLLPC